VSDDKVIHAFPARELPDCPVEIEQRLRLCSHAAIRLIPHDRQVSCSSCGATLDPFDYLMKEAEAIRRGWQGYQHACRLIEEKRQQVADLEKQKKRLQGQIRTLNLRGKKD
jgi:hypothetical protein